MTRYYFASRYSRHEELRSYREELMRVVSGATVTSRWIDLHNNELEASFTPEALAADPAGCWKYGQADLEDLANSEVIVSFTGPGGKGGRHIEHGVAIAYFDNHIWLDLGGPPRDAFRLTIVGPRENVFHCHPATEVFATWGEFLWNELRSQS